MKTINTKPNFLPDIVLNHTKNQPESIAYTFVCNNSLANKSISYAELDYRARLLAEIFYTKNLVQERIILLYPAGLEFIVAYLACLYSGGIAIPLNCSDRDSPEKFLALTKTIIQQANAKMIVTTDLFLDIIKQKLSIAPQQIEILSTDFIYTQQDNCTFTPISVSSDMLTHLQYTSGSASSPKGVICTHHNLAHSLFATANRWQYSAKSITVSWAPHSHVYGLTAGLLVPLYSGSQAILISAHDFLTNPISWLKTISDYKATHSGCPNFGYEFCIEHIEDEELNALNLSDWRVASNGGESVQFNTLVKFFNKFNSTGFKFENFYPAYGMSECTGLIATHPADSKPVFSFFDKKELQINHVVAVTDTSQQALVSCGIPINGITIKIVNPETRQEEVVSDHIGEVWITGPICTKGYWNTTDSPLGLLSNDKTNPYIRTGDLGFILNGELFLVGRLKEIIMLYGKNYYPHDIEMDVKNSNVHFTHNACAAFSERVGNNEELFIIQEIENNLSENEYISAIASAHKSLALKHSIDAYAIVLVNQNSIPKTASGKLQRKMASQKYFKRTFDIVYESIKEPA